MKGGMTGGMAVGFLGNCVPQALPPPWSRAFWVLPVCFCAFVVTFSMHQASLLVVQYSPSPASASHLLVRLTTLLNIVGQNVGLI